MPKLYQQDQDKVDAVLSRGIYRVERKPFRPWALLLVILAVLGVITVLSYGIAAYYGYL